VGSCGAGKEARPKQESVHRRGMRRDNNAAHAEPGYARCFALPGAGRKWRDGPVNVSSEMGRGSGRWPRTGRGTRGICVHVMHSMYRSPPFYRTLLIKRRDPIAKIIRLGPERGGKRFARDANRVHKRGATGNMNRLAVRRREIARKAQ